ncbi:hypothetical protein BC834DRAFT_669965 [Gloeopeniophorella convolvens]|nr:hypothetical protein BC834DRAFT_669965 [Gloeopeniophorella convolvens]
MTSEWSLASVFPMSTARAARHPRRLRSPRNDFPIARSKVLLGFLSTLLYSTGVTNLIAITSGADLGCDTRSFPMVKEWDKVTMLEAPHLGKLQVVEYVDWLADAPCNHERKEP